MTDAELKAHLDARHDMVRHMGELHRVGCAPTWSAIKAKHETDHEHCGRPDAHSH